MLKNNKIKILVITKLFPEKKRPLLGIFHKVLLDYIAKKYNNTLQFTVIKPTAWIPMMPFIKPLCPRKTSKNNLSFDESDYYHIHYPEILSYGRHLLFMQGLSYYLSLRKKYNTFIKEYNIIHSYWLYPDGYASVMLGKKYNIPVIVHACGSDINILMYKKNLTSSFNYILRNCRNMIVVSNDLKEKVIKMFPEFKSKIIVARNGVEISRFNNINIEESFEQVGTKKTGNKIITFVGRVEDTKGISQLLEACRIILQKRNDFNLFLIGTCQKKDYKRYSKLISKNHLDNNITFVGEIDHGLIKHWLNVSHFFVLPSFTEGTPMVVLEALATGTPVVATKVGGIPDLINDNSGQLVNVNNVNELANAMVNQLNMKKNKKILRDDIDISFQAKTIVKLYETILEEKCCS